MRTKVLQVIRKTKVILLLILLLASFLRLWKLDSIPPHLSPDEASLGYNAYSLLKTGKDEFGNSFPLLLKSFGDYKPALYAYLTIPFIKVFGLNEFAVRLPSAISGIVVVWVFYLWILEWTRNKRLALYSAFLLSTLPWHILLSRGAWEVNVCFTLTVAGAYYFFKFILNEDKLKRRYLFFSSVLFSLTLLTYQGAKLSTVIICLVLIIFFWKKILKVNKKSILIALFVAGIITVPVTFSLVTGKAGRLSVFSVFSYPRPDDYLNAFLLEGNETTTSLSYNLFHPEWLNFVRGIVGRFFNHYSGRYLFFEGDWQNYRHSIPNMGVLLWVGFPLLLVGLIKMIRDHKSMFLFTALLLLLTPLPSVLSRDQVHAVRSLQMIVPLVTIQSFGLVALTKYRLGAYLTTVGFGVCLVFFLDAYFIHMPRAFSRHWQYGIKQAIQEVLPIKDNYKKLIFQQSYSQPYIYFLFWTKYEPSSYQLQSKAIHRVDGNQDVGLTEELDNILFKPADINIYKHTPGYLLIGDRTEIYDESLSDPRVRLIKEIKYLNNIDVALRIVETVEEKEQQ